MTHRDYRVWQRMKKTGNGRKIKTLRWKEGKNQVNKANTMNKENTVNRANTALTWMMTLLISLIAVDAVSDNPITNSSEPVNTVIHHTAIKNSKSIQDIPTVANRWGLSVSDYMRYTEIIQGPLGRWNPQIDPVLALGIYADNDVDKQRYAELYAQQEYNGVRHHHRYRIKSGFNWLS